VLKSDNFDHPDLEAILAKDLLRENPSGGSSDTPGHDN
jgi:hypothetical protein